MPIERPLPIVEQVVKLLRNRIKNREFAFDGRLPSESELADELGVSRATIRSALVTLATEGLILRKHGDGTYVNRRILDVKSQIGEIWEFNRLIKESGYHSSIKPLKVFKRLPSETEILKLDLSDDQQVISVNRLFLADDQPVVLSENVIPETKMKCDLEAYNAAFSLYEFVETYCGQQISYAIADINSILAPKAIAGALKVEVGFPLLQFVEIFYSKNDIPLVYAKNYYNDKTIKLRLVRSWR
jgi:GntR family transcriptional regulator